METKIYSGRFSVVYKSGNEAIKVVDEDFKVPPHDVKREIELVRNLNHENIIKFNKIDRKFDDILIFMDFYPWNLNDWVIENSKKRTKFGETITYVYQNQLNDETIEPLLSQIFESIRYIHQQGIIHRDIKPTNFLVKQDQDKVKLVLCDFSVSILESKNDMIHDVCTNFYKPLELIFSLDYGKEIDIWSLGILISFLYSKHCKPLIWDDDHEISDFQLIKLIFDNFGIPNKDPHDINYWEEIFHIDSFNLVKLKPIKRDQNFNCTNQIKVDLFNKICNLNPKRRLTIDQIVEIWNEIVGR